VKIKFKNTLLVFKVIKRNYPISRTSISHLTKLSLSTVSRCVDYLIKAGFVKERGQGNSNGGRKPVLLELCKNSSFSVGVEVGEAQVNFIVINPSDEVVCSSSVRFNPGESSEELFDLIQENFFFILKKNNIDLSKVVSFGIGLPGITSPDMKNLIIAPNLNWKQIPVSTLLEERLNIPVFSENGANLMAFAQHKHLNLDKNDITLGIIIGTGIGAGLVLNNEIFHGGTGGALEAGHMVISESSSRCNCGRRGCAEVLASVPALLKRFSACSENKTLSLEDFKFALDRGDQKTFKILEEEIKYLSILITNLVNLINPTHIFIGGEIAIIGKYMIQQLKERVYGEALTPNKIKLKISFTNNEEKDIPYGAAALAMEQVIDGHIIRRK